MTAVLHFQNEFKSADDPELTSWLRALNAPKETVTFFEDWLAGKTHYDIQTSGTTGRPKTIRVNRNDMRRSAQSTLDFLQLVEGTSLLHCLPLRYIAGQMMMVRGLVGNMHIYLEAPRANPFLNFTSPIDFVALTPHQLREIMTMEESRKQLRQTPKVIVGGGAVDQDLLEELQPWENEVFSTYGMTESLSHFAMKRLSGGSQSSFELISYDFKISTDAHQCLVVETPYEHAPVLVTNDVVEIVDDHRFRWLGRIDDVINSGGIKVHAGEVEAALSGVIGVPFFITAWSHAQLGECVAIVFREMDVPTDLKTLLTSALEDKYWRPLKLLVVEDFQLTGNGKIQKKESLESVVSEKEL